MNLSIALCTYNATAYLSEQLASIAAQTRLPDELVVCDDCSGDATAAAVRQFAARAPFEVRLEVNDRNLGTAANFAKAAGLCRGRFIALCDQDDVWMPHKLQLLHDALVRHPRAGFAFSNARIVDRHRRPLGYNLWEAIRFPRSEQRRMNRGQAASVLLHRNVVTGATMAFRADYRDLLLPVAHGWLHDGWFALLLAAVADCVAVPEPLIEYRQHPGQQVGARKETLFQQFLRARSFGQEKYESIAANYAAARDRLAQCPMPLRDPGLLPAIERKVKHYGARTRMREEGTWRLPLILRELVWHHYTRFSTGWKSFAQDLLL
ncbi:MAG: glycosyltransferase family 2 protein [Thermoguttaceae bacterium]|jgi:glycosyltransferase involved in cell wall biosynthesis